MSPLIVNTVGIPLGLGLVLGLIVILLPQRTFVQVLAFGAAILLVYLLLEGAPAFPPVSGKQRLMYLLVAAIPLTFLAEAPAFTVLRQWAAPAFLAVALLWLGWGRLLQPAIWPLGLLLFAPVVATLVSQPSEKQSQPERAFLWPAALLVFAIGAAILSLLGVFVGFAQLLGAMAALLGGALLVLYVQSLIRDKPATLTHATQRLVLMALGAISLMVGLFAPKVSLAAFALLSLVLCVPAIAPSLATSPRWLRPVLFGLMAAVPAALSIITAVMVAE